MEKIAADDLPRRALSTTGNTQTELISIAKQAAIMNPPFKYSKTAGGMEKIEEDSIAKPRESLTYAPSLMAHVYHDQAPPTDACNKSGKD